MTIAARYSYAPNLKKRPMLSKYLGFKNRPNHGLSISALEPSEHTQTNDSVEKTPVKGNWMYAALFWMKSWSILRRIRKGCKIDLKHEKLSHVASYGVFHPVAGEPDMSHPIGPLWVVSKYKDRLT